MKIKRYCEICGKEFEYSPLVHKNRRFCSKLCFAQWKSQNLRGKNNYHWQGGKVEKRCLICNKTFYVSRYRVKIGEGKLCSRKCMGIWRTINIRGKNHWHWQGERIQRKCLMCNKSFTIQQYTVKEGVGQFCSTKCYHKYDKIHGLNAGENNPNWIGGASFEPYGIEFNNKLRKQIRKRDNFICRECGYTEKQIGRKLDIHHINYNKLDNRPENLISLCRSCHIQTNFKREDWIKYFQNMEAF